MPIFVFSLVSIVIILDCLSNIFVSSELQDAQEAAQKAEAAQKRAAVQFRYECTTLGA
jgi:hypothetical protein